MNPVTSHCAVTESMANSSMMAIRPIFTRFSLKPARNAPPYKTAKSMVDCFPCIPENSFFGRTKGAALLRIHASPKAQQLDLRCEMRGAIYARMHGELLTARVIVANFNSQEGAYS